MAASHFQPSDPQRPPLPSPDPVEAAIKRHQGARDELQRASNAAETASAADGAAWADLLATRPDDVTGAVRLLRYVAASPASEVVEDPQDLLRQLVAVVEAAETVGRASPASANLPTLDAEPDPIFATIAEYRAAWDAAVVATREGNGDVPDEASEAMMQAYDRLRAIRPTTAAGYRALAETWAWRQAQDGEPGDTLGEQIAESLIAGAGVCVPASAGPDPIEAMIAAHLAARDAFTATVDAQDVDWVREHGGDTSDAAMAPARAAWRAADQVEVATWNALFDVRPVTPRGAAALIRHVAKWGPDQDGHADAIGLADALATIADGLVGMLGATSGAEPVDWHAPPPGLMASPAIEPFGFVSIPEGIAIELGRLRGIAVAEFERLVQAGVTGEALERLRRNLCLDILSQVARGEGSFDVPLSGPRDWQAYAAGHPGFVPFPAHAPSALVALDLAIRGEAERLLSLADAEIDRRRQDYAGYPDPEVWPQVERSLRREMRMEALAAVGEEPADDGEGPDPALAAIDASRRAEAEMAAFQDGLAEAMTPELRAREEALCEAQRATRAAAWTTVPTTPAGRLALVNYARFQVEVDTELDGRVGSPRELLTEILGAFSAAIAAERPETAPTSTGAPTEREPSNLDALALVSAIEAEWAVWKALDAAPDNDPALEDSRARRDDLLDAAAALPATTREARHAKALALAWIHYVGEWRRDQRYEDYSLDGRLALDIDTGFGGIETAEHPDAALLALGPTIAALIAARDAVSSEHEEAYAQVDGLVLAEGRRLAHMRARTLDGLVLKARFVERGADEELKDAIVADLLAMGGGQ